MGIDVNEVVGVAQKLGFFGRVGKFFAGVAKVAVNVAGWASQHPEVVGLIKQVGEAAVLAAHKDKD